MLENRLRAVTDERLSPEEAALFDAFIGAAVTVQRNVDADLMYERNRSLSEYQTLRRLAEAPDQRLRMNELAVAAFLSLSRMSRIVEKLERQGLVRREQAEGDRRGWNAILTEAGAQWLRRSECAYATSVRRHVLDNLDNETLSVLTTAARRIAHISAHHRARVA